MTGARRRGCPPVEAAITDLLVACRAPVDGRHHLAAPRAELRRPSPRPARRRLDAVLARLDAWRAHAAKVARVPAQADRRRPHPPRHRRGPPGSVEALVGLPGLGPIKAARFGDGILALPSRPMR